MGLLLCSHCGVCKRDEGKEDFCVSGSLSTSQYCLGDMDNHGINTVQF